MRRRCRHNGAAFCQKNTFLFLSGWVGALRLFSATVKSITPVNPLSILTVDVNAWIPNTVNANKRPPFAPVVRTFADRIAKMTTTTTTEEQEDNTALIDENTPVWCPEQQIYVGGVVPGASDEDVEALLEENGGSLPVFGYGSLCWNPGTPDTALGHASVTSTLGYAQGYRRTWGQRSTDHRGTPDFPGVVCTLLQNTERQAILQQKSDTKNSNHDDEHPQMTEGMIYVVPPELARQCLAELDFREKGGYAREIIQVIPDPTSSSNNDNVDNDNTVRALLYRGTPDNPAFWSRLVWDLPLAAAIMAVSVGPSGPNTVYLNQLDEFLKQQSQSHDSNSLATAMLQDDDTCSLANMTRYFQQHVNLYFFCACGSNQHGQLGYCRNSPPQSDIQKDGDEDIPQVTEAVLGTPRSSSTPLNENTVDPPQALYAGGGHSGLLTLGGQLYLWGWNEQGQCGTTTTTNAGNVDENAPPIPMTHAITLDPNNNKALKVQKAALGFYHTLLLERDTGFVCAMGDNTWGQITGEDTAGKSSSSSSSISTPTTPSCLKGVSCVDVAAGVFHSAVITQEGELVTFGCNKQGQSLGSNNDGDNPQTIATGTWKPTDGSRLVKVACGRQSTVVVDDQGRIWTFGDNKYGQLGRPLPLIAEQNIPVKDTTSSNGAAKKKRPPTFDPLPQLVEGVLGQEHPATTKSTEVSRYRCIDIDCGWSHTVARVVKEEGSDQKIQVFGWGRSDKGQLGCQEKAVSSPHYLPADEGIAQIFCGSESTYVWNENTQTLYSCGWNEHGNLGLGFDKKVEEDVYKLTTVPDTRRIVGPPTYSKSSVEGGRKLLLAAGGAHLLAMKT